MGLNLMKAWKPGIVGLSWKHFNVQLFIFPSLQNPCSDYNPFLSPHCQTLLCNLSLCCFGQTVSDGDVLEATNTLQKSILCFWINFLTCSDLSPPILCEISYLSVPS